MPNTMWSAVEREDCFRDPRITVYTLPRPVKRQDLTMLRPFGPVSFFENFSRPFFRMDRPSLFLLTGVIGSAEIRVTFKRSASPHVRAMLERQIEKMIGCNGCGECVSLCTHGAMAVPHEGGPAIADASCTSCLECVAGSCRVLDISTMAME